MTLNDLLVELEQRWQRCEEAERKLDAAHAAGTLTSCLVDVFDMDVKQYQELINRAALELDGLDEKLRNLK